MAARKGTREESKKRLKRLEEGYPVRDPKTGKIRVIKAKKKGSKTARDRRTQRELLKDYM